MNEYKPNSHKYKEEQKALAEEKHIAKVVSGTAKTKKRSGVHKFTDVFVAEDIHNVLANVTNDVIIPSLKNVVFDAIKNGSEMLLYRVSGRRSGGSGPARTSYRNYYDRREDDRRSYEGAKARPRSTFDDIIFETRGDAELVIDDMHKSLREYGVVSVADMYDMAGLRQPYTSGKFGWYNISRAEVVRLRDGYIIRLPEAEAI